MLSKYGKQATLRSPALKRQTMPFNQGLQKRKLYSRRKLYSKCFSTSSHNSKWISLKVSEDELRPSMTLVTGQTFRWLARDGNPGEFVGVIGNKIVVVREDLNNTSFRVAEADEIGGHADISKESDNSQDMLETVKDYFNLRPGICLADMDAVFCRGDDRYKEISPYFQGARVLRQEPLECLLSFICSSNNNIRRITMMIEKLCSTYGTRIGEFDGRELYSFPTLSQLQK